MHATCSIKFQGQTFFSWNTILSAYSKSGNLSKMEEVFKIMPRKDGVSWNLIIPGYASFGLCNEALEAYKLMRRDGLVNLDRITLGNGYIVIEPGVD